MNHDIECQYFHYLQRTRPKSVSPEDFDFEDLDKRLKRNEVIEWALMPMEIAVLYLEIIDQSWILSKYDFGTSDFNHIVAGVVSGLY